MNRDRVDGRPGLPDEEQAAGFVGREAGEVGLEAVRELDPAAGAASGEDRHAGLLSASTSRRMVRSETSSVRASSGAVRRPRRCNTSSMSSTRAARIGRT